MMLQNSLETEGQVWASTPNTVNEFVQSRLMGGPSADWVEMSRIADSKIQKAVASASKRAPTFDWTTRYNDGQTERQESRLLALGSYQAEIIYWTRIHMDHCTLLFGMLNSSDPIIVGLREQTAGILDDWTSFANAYGVQYPGEVDIGSSGALDKLNSKDLRADPREVLKNQYSLEDESSTFYPNGEAFNDFATNVVNTIQLILEIHDAACEIWPGFGLYPSFLLHILGESMYASKKVINGEPINVPQEVIYWSEHNAEHALQERQYADPSESGKIASLNNAVDVGRLIATQEGIQGDCGGEVGIDTCGDEYIAMVALFNREILADTEETRDLARDPDTKIKSTAPPLIVTHNIFEYQYGDAVISSLNPYIEEILEDINLPSLTRDTALDYFRGAFLGDHSLSLSSSMTGTPFNSVIASSRGSTAFPRGAATTPFNGATRGTATSFNGVTNMANLL